MTASRNQGAHRLKHHEGRRLQVRSTNRRPVGAWRGSRFGMYRTRYRGEDGVARCAYRAGIANNLMAIGRHGR
ncbi:MAG: hypothetical protein M3O50_14615 [Myxococcota bacterium]|nr:hypothetical protein [Myxococcota bacterium]